MNQVQKTQESLRKHEKKICKANEDEKAGIDALLKAHRKIHFRNRLETGHKNLDKLPRSQLGDLCKNSKKIEEFPRL